MPYLSWVSDMATGYVTWLIKVHDMHLGRVTRLECETWLKFMNQWLRYIHDPCMYALHRAWLCDLALVLFFTIFGSFCPFSSVWLVTCVHTAIFGGSYSSDAYIVFCQPQSNIDRGVKVCIRILP